MSISLRLELMAAAMTALGCRQIVQARPPVPPVSLLLARGAIVGESDHTRLVIEFPLHSPRPGSECSATARGIFERLVEFTVIEIEIIFKSGCQKRSFEEGIIRTPIHQIPPRLTLFDGHKVLDNSFGRQVLELDLELSSCTSRYTFEGCLISDRASGPLICHKRQGR